MLLIENFSIDTPEKIHDLRVKTKLLRSYWRFAQPMLLDGAEFSRHNDRLKTAAKVFSGARENEVNRE